MKLAPVDRRVRARGTIEHLIVHTGQHYDDALSAGLFRELEIPEPDVNLGVGSGSHARQTAAIMVKLEDEVARRRPDMLLVYGDVNSTVAAALVASKLGVPVAHVEAGLRSRDLTMPEEINRIVTDRLSSLLFIPSRDAGENLRREGADPAAIQMVGNVMIDTLVASLGKAKERGAPARFGVTPGGFVVVTLHRPSNVDRPEVLREICLGLRALAAELERAVLFPVHPRTRRALGSVSMPAGRLDGVRLLDPLPYLDMLGLVADAALVVTDSGGLQEETTYLGVPCLTVRPNTERPITIEQGTNRLVEPTADALVTAAREARRSEPRKLEGWDGRAGERIAAVLCDGMRYD